MHDLIGVYVLGALDADELLEFEAHLAGCAECQTELALLEEGAALLADGEVMEPPAGILDRVLAAAPTAAPAAADEQLAPVVPIRRPRGLIAALSVAAAAVVALGVWNVTLLQREPEFQAEAAFALSGETDAAGTVTVGDDGEVVLVLTNLPDAPAERVYQLWYGQTDGTVVPGPTFEPENGVAIVTTDADVPVAGAAVSIEPEGGSEQPTEVVLASF